MTRMSTLTDLKNICHTYFLSRIHKELKVSEKWKSLKATCLPVDSIYYLNVMLLYECVSFIHLCRGNHLTP